MLVENRQFEPTPPLFGVTPLEFREIFGNRKLQYLGYRVALFA